MIWEPYQKTKPPKMETTLDLRAPSPKNTPHCIENLEPINDKASLLDFLHSGRCPLHVASGKYLFHSGCWIEGIDTDNHIQSGAIGSIIYRALRNMGYARLLDTDGGSLLNQAIPQAVRDNAEVDEIWRSASRLFAGVAKGHVICLINNPRESAIFSNDELPLLLENSRISSLNGIPLMKCRHTYQSAGASALMTHLARSIPRMLIQGIAA